MLLKNFLEFAYEAVHNEPRENIDREPVLALLDAMKIAVEQNDYNLFENSFNNFRNIISDAPSASFKAVIIYSEFHRGNISNLTAQDWWRRRNQDDCVSLAKKNPYESNDTGNFGLFKTSLNNNLSDSADSTNAIDLARIDPKRVIVVCIRGWGGVSSSNVDEYEAEKKAIMAEIAAAYINANLPFQSTDLGAVAETYMNQLGDSGTTGMSILREKIYNALKEYKVPAENVIYTNWRDSSLTTKINALQPLYLAIIGHSLGGCIAARVSAKVSKIPNFVGLIDPVFFPKPDSTCPNSNLLEKITTKDQDSDDDNYPKGSKIISWYQTANCPRGFHPVKGAKKNNKTKEEYAVTNTLVSGVIHTTIDDHKPIHDTVVKLITGGVRPSEVALPIQEQEGNKETAYSFSKLRSAL